MYKVNCRTGTSGYWKRSDNNRVTRNPLQFNPSLMRESDPNTQFNRIKNTDLIRLIQSPISTVLDGLEICTAKGLLVELTDQFCIDVIRCVTFKMCNFYLRNVLFQIRGNSKNV